MVPAMDSAKLTILSYTQNLGKMIKAAQKTSNKNAWLLVSTQ